MSETKAYMTVKEAVAKWGLNIDRVRVLCSSEVAIPGAKKVKGVWRIPADAERPPEYLCQTSASLARTLQAYEEHTGKKAPATAWAAVPPSETLPKAPAASKAKTASKTESKAPSKTASKDDNKVVSNNEDKVANKAEDTAVDHTSSQAATSATAPTATTSVATEQVSSTARSTGLSTSAESSAEEPTVAATTAPTESNNATVPTESNNATAETNNLKVAYAAATSEDIKAVEEAIANAENYANELRKEIQSRKEALNLEAGANKETKIDLERFTSHFIPLKEFDIQPQLDTPLAEFPPQAKVVKENRLDAFTKLRFNYKSAQITSTIQRIERKNQCLINRFVFNPEAPEIGERLDNAFDIIMTYGTVLGQSINSKVAIGIIKNQFLPKISPRVKNLLRNAYENLVFHKQLDNIDPLKRLDLETIYATYAQISGQAFSKEKSLRSKPSILANAYGNIPNTDPALIEQELAAVIDLYNNGKYAPEYSPDAQLIGALPADHFYYQQDWQYTEIMDRFALLYMNLVRIAPFADPEIAELTLRNLINNEIVKLGYRHVNFDMHTPGYWAMMREQAFNYMDPLPLVIALLASMENYVDKMLVLLDDDYRKIALNS